MEGGGRGGGGGNSPANTKMPKSEKKDVEKVIQESEAILLQRMEETMVE